MDNILRAVVRDGRIEVLDQQFWQGVNQISLDAIWNNPEDDICAQLLKG